MQRRHPDRSLVYGWPAGMLLLGMLACAGAWASPPAESAAVLQQSAVWTSKELNFDYHGFATKYSCDGLRDKMRDVLRKLGAADLDVRSGGCMRSFGPDPLASVRIRMNVLEPAGTQGGPAVAAHWQMVDLVAGRSPVESAADCELIEQIKLKVLPLFATRRVDYGASCTRRQSQLAPARLQAEVLVADTGPAPSAVR